MSIQPRPCSQFTGAAARAAAAPGGYAWWYVEVHDAEGRFGLTLILFAGSVFSPRYAALLRAGVVTCGLDVPAVNFSFYERTRGSRPGTRRAWVMNEYPRAALALEADAVRVANTALCLPATGPVTIELDEDTTRFFGRRGPRVHGRITVAPPPPAPPPLYLGESARGEAHYWQPLAPRAAATVELQLGPRQVRFQGLAYLDRNYGSGRLEDTFSRWGWAHGFPAAPAGPSDANTSAAVNTSAAADTAAVANTPAAAHALDASPDRAAAPGAGDALIVYNAVLTAGHSRQLYVRYSDSARPPEVGSVELAPSSGALAAVDRDLFWLPVPRAFGAGPYTCRRLPGGTLEDTPFYARFAVHIERTAEGPAGPAFAGVGEYLDLDRFRRRSLQYLLRYKTRYIATVPAPGAAR